MRRTTHSLLFLIITSLFVFSSLHAQTANVKQLVGKWLVADFSYKSAEHPDQDYTLSRKDFENMVKFKRTITIANDREMSEQYGDMHINYVYQIDGTKLYYWIPASQDGRTKLDEAVRSSTKTAVYDISFDQGQMVLTKQNSAFILKLKLQKQ
jgi:hypothetical protein